MQSVNKKIKSILNKLGFDITRIDQVRQCYDSSGSTYLRHREENTALLNELGIIKAHYGSGGNLFGDGWVNIDIQPTNPDTSKLYMSADLTARHPFPSGYFQFAFAEDFLEHLTQEESLIFLSEIFRCLRPGGVIRLSFPGLKDVLRRQYRSSDYEGATVGRQEAYTHWQHKHFYCKESLAIVAEHLGFSDITFTQFNKSAHRDLADLEHRADQQDLNIYVELTK